ncbi:MAG: KOW domain-containing RNA-binding protein [Eubacteriales bacterium]|nr:KOW domain-containing RNA-binding protein [Eubacteriales bacterium]
MKQLEKGMFARSLAGHDKGRLYIVLEENDKFVLLADGIRATVEKPKRKKRLHVQPDFHSMFLPAEIEMGQQTLNNEKIIKAIKVKEGHSCLNQM